jgi:phosphoribosylformimino-5-aminoimidazole carboxamide ribotide isomerase
MSFNLIPAIDIRGGRVVRLAQGDYARQTDFDADPVALAAAFAGAGARWLHVVDLDAARSGGWSLGPLVRAIRARTQLRIQTGGGVRGEHDFAAILEAGAERVVVGTLAVREPMRVADWLAREGGDRLVLALDARQGEDGRWRVPVAGWTAESGATLEGLLQHYAGLGLRHALCTDIARDGMLSGFNLDLYRWIAGRWPRVQVQASGGVRGLGDIEGAREAGAAAAILGRALLEGRFDLREALERAEAAC